MKTNKTRKSDEEFVIDFQTEFLRDLSARKVQHRKMNYHYLQYKGILWLNSVYGEDYLRTVGLQAFVPRTFMTIESIRPHLSGRPLDIWMKGFTYRARQNSTKAANLLKAEWFRSGADWEKADAEFYSLLLGNGYLLSRMVDDKEVDVPIPDGVADDGTLKYKNGDLQRYKGMKVFSLNPWNVFPDRKAKNDKQLRHMWLYSLWNFDEWMDECEKKGFNTEGMIKGGHLEEFDRVRRQVDVIYGASNMDIKTRDHGQLVSQPLEIEQMDMSEMIMVVEKFSKREYSICSGANWTLNHREANPDPDKIIPIKTIRDYTVPDEFDGIGEAEAIRWQQYQENKVHNLTYMSVLMNTVQRYGILEEYLEDPTEASFSNPLKWIHMKNVPGGDINKAIIPLNQKSSNDVPDKFLAIINRIQQETTGVNDIITSGPDSAPDTLGEVNMLRQAGMERILQKAYQIEERDLVDVLKHWLACFPVYYIDDLDLYVDKMTDKAVKFLPYDRTFDTHIPTIAAAATKLGVSTVAKPTMDTEPRMGNSGHITLTEVYKEAGYEDVIFASDVMEGYDIGFRTLTTTTDKEAMFKQFDMLMDKLMEVNVHEKEMGRPPKFDITKLSEEALRLFPDLIKDPNDYIISEPTPPAVMPGQQPVVPPGTLPAGLPPGAGTTVPATAPAAPEAPPATAPAGTLPAGPLAV